MASDPNDQRGLQFMEEAKKKLNSSTGFITKLLGGGSSKQEEAADLYNKAANNFKMAKNWSAAGNAFCECAKIHLQQGSRHDAATAFIDAGNCYRKADPKEAVACLVKAIDIYTDMGRFTIAAKHHMTIAEIFESDVADLDQAIKHYEKSYDYYKGEESTSSANKCYLKVAQLSVQRDPPDYEKSANIFEQLGVSAMDNRLLTYSAKDHFYKANLLHLCIDLINAQNAMQRFKDIHPAYADSRECKLLEKLIAAMEEENVEDFTAAVADYDSISRVDQWTTSLLLRIKHEIQGEDDLK